jgi:hypothetical protein
MIELGLAININQYLTTKKNLIFEPIEPDRLSGITIKNYII